MVINAADELILRELANSPLLRARLSGSLRKMETELLQSAAHRFGIPVSGQVDVL